MNNISLSESNQTLIDNQNKLQSRVLGLDMCLKGLSLFIVLDGGDVSIKMQKAKVLKDILMSLQTGLSDQVFMEGIDQSAFFSSAKGIMEAIDNVILQLEKLQENSHE